MTCGPLAPVSRGARWAPPLAFCSPSLTRSKLSVLLLIRLGSGSVKIPPPSCVFPCSPRPFKLSGVSDIDRSAPAGDVPPPVVFDWSFSGIFFLRLFDRCSTFAFWPDWDGLPCGDDLSLALLFACLFLLRLLAVHPAGAVSGKAALGLEGLKFLLKRVF